MTRRKYGGAVEKDGCKLAGRSDDNILIAIGLGWRGEYRIARGEPPKG
jgi:hypothetical protein